MINTIISQIDHENIMVTRYNEDDSTYTYIGTFTVSVQGVRSYVKIQGSFMEKSLKGFDINSLFIMYSPNIDIQVGDIIIRNGKDNLTYEVEATEPKGVGTLLEHRESLIRRIENQDE